MVEHKEENVWTRSPFQFNIYNDYFVVYVQITGDDINVVGDSLEKMTEEAVVTMIRGRSKHGDINDYDSGGLIRKGRIRRIWH